MPDTIVHKEALSKLSVLKVNIAMKNRPLLKIVPPLITVQQVRLSLLNVQMEHIALLVQVLVKCALLELFQTPKGYVLYKIANNAGPAHTVKIQAWLNLVNSVTKAIIARQDLLKAQKQFAQRMHSALRELQSLLSVHQENITTLQAKLNLLTVFSVNLVNIAQDRVILKIVIKDTIAPEALQLQNKT